VCERGRFDPAGSETESKRRSDIPGERLLSQKLPSCSACSLKRSPGFDTLVHHRYAMEITINTPALLFPATSLLMISYTTRFLHIANLIRNLHPLEPGEPKEIVFRQIANLRRRIRLIRNMQAAGVTSLLLCVVCMFLLFGSQIFLAQVCFAISLVFMIASLVLSLWEIWISVDAVNLHLDGIQGSKER
jgi:hypothetical protein